MAEMEVRIQGQTVSSTTVPVSGAVTVSGTVSAVLNRVDPVTNAAITGNVTGAATDEGAAITKLTIQSNFGSVGTLTGTMTVQGSFEGTLWTDLGTIAVGTGVVMTTFSTHLLRHWRITFAGAAGSGSITNRAMSAQT